jgi:hypothetical protein
MVRAALVIQWSFSASVSKWRFAREFPVANGTFAGIAVLRRLLL